MDIVLHTEGWRNAAASVSGPNCNGRRRSGRTTRKYAGGFWPRAASALSYGIIVALAPAVEPNWTAALMLISAGFVLAIAGV